MRSLIPILTFLFFCLNLKVCAQTNPYKIKDNLYTMFLHAGKFSRTSKEFIAATDSMFAMAKEEKDVKAQCIALQLKSQYYSRCVPYSEEKHRRYLDYCKAFIVKTEFKQYYFNSWGVLITHFINEREYSKALVELKQYQQDALKFKNNYGIAFSYLNMGNIYNALRLYNQAIDQYKKGADHLEKVNETNELAYFYRSLGTVYQYILEYDKAYYYLKKALDSCKVKAQEVLCYYHLINLSMEAKQPEEIVKEYHKKLIEMPKEYFRISKISQMYLEYKYYKYLKDWEKADYYFKEYKKIPESSNNYSIIAGWYAEHNDFQNAYIYERMNIWQKDSILNSGITEVAALYSVQYDNATLMLNQKQLELENRNYQIERMGVEQKFLLTSREKDSLMILSVKQYHRADSIQMEKARIEAESQKAEALQRQQFQKRLFFLISLVFFVIILSAVIYLVTQKRNNRRLKKEKQIAIESQHKAEEAQAVSEETGKKLVVALEEAKKADRLKGQFLNNMSHEIRTPLNAIVGFTELLNGNMAGELGEDEKKEMLSLVAKNSTLLTTLINDVLDLSRLQSGNYKIEPQECNLDDLCSDAVASVKSRACDGVEMAFVKHDTDRIIYTDSNRVTQVLINYLTNACKYTEKGSITLDYKVYNDSENCEWADISVTDTGCGIPMEKAGEVFNRFEKLNEFKQGTGLGLNICKTIAEILHGRVWLDTTYKSGCRFVFSIPCRYK